MVKYLLNDGEASVNCVGVCAEEPTKGIKTEFVAIVFLIKGEHTPGIKVDENKFGFLKVNLHFYPGDTINKTMKRKTFKTFSRHLIVFGCIAMTSHLGREITYLLWHS